MSRYIDADAWEPYFYEHMDDAHMAAAKNALDDMPTAHVVSEEVYDRLFEKYEELVDKFYSLHDQIDVQNMLIQHFFIERSEDDTK